MTSNGAVPSPSLSSPEAPYSVIHVEDPVAFSRDSGETYQAPARRVFQDVRESKGIDLDHDEDKYKRRPAREWIMRLWK